MTDFDQSTASNFVRDVVALGRKHSKAAFPNPTREGCPSRGSLRAMAYRSRQITLADLPLSHIVTCSPCFRDYTHFRRISSIVRGIQITAAACLLVLVLALAATRFVWKETGAGLLSKSAQQSAPRSGVATKAPKAAIRPIPMAIDLASLSPTRGDDAKAGTNKKIRLPQKLLRVIFVLPLGMEEGQYTVRLQSSTGIVVFEKIAVGYINDGTASVETDLDLSAVSRGNLILMIKPPGLNWRRFPAVVD